MKHEEIKQLISQEYDGEATPVVIDLIEKHVKECVDCFKYRESLNKMSTVLESWEDEELSPDAETKIRGFIQGVASDEEVVTMKPKNRLIKYGFGGGVLLSAVLAIVFMQTYAQRSLQGRVRDASHQLVSLSRSGVQGRLKSATDDIGDQFSPGNTNVVKTMQLAKNERYEPYYLTTKYNAERVDDTASSAVLDTSQEYWGGGSTGYEGKAKAKIADFASRPAITPVEAQLALNRGVQQRNNSARKRSAGGYQESSYSTVPALAVADGKLASAKQFEQGVSRSQLYNEEVTVGSMNSQVLNVEQEYWGGDSVEVRDGNIGREYYEYDQDDLYYRRYPTKYDRSQQVYYRPNTEEYQHIYENHFTQAATTPLSTFSIDVDTASYSNMRRFLNSNQLPPVNAVRIEEMVNYFDYDYPEPMWNQPFSVTTHASYAPWNRSHYLVQIGIKGKTLKANKLPPSNLVFLVDVSGSMNQPNKLPLLKQSLQLMVDQLGPNERIAIVTYAGSAGLALPSTPGSNKYVIKNAINNLRAGGSTAGAAGIRLAYQVARQNFIKKGNNRVLLATDGDFNVGVSSDHELVRLIEQERNSGIFLSILGFGSGNLKDAKMKKIANNGNGTYYYIDSIIEGEKCLGKELGSTLFTIAKDVKIQVEFNPQQVAYYKLIGYEDRLLAKEDFNNDFVDAGELGAGHTVTALYEVVPVGGTHYQQTSVDPLKYQGGMNFFKNKDLMTVKLRYKNPDGFTSKLIKKVVHKRDISSQPKGDLQFAAAVAEFGLLLRNSPTRGYADYVRVIHNARTAMGKDLNGYRSEFIRLVEKAASIDHRVQPYAQPYLYPAERQFLYPHKYQGNQESNIQFK